MFHGEMPAQRVVGCERGEGDRAPIWVAAALSVVCGSWACSPPEPRPPTAETPSGASSSEPRREQAPLAPPVGAPPTAATGRRVFVETHAVPQDIDDDAGPAPCDFDRGYRGKVDVTPITVVLHARERSLEGLSHYDREGASTPLSGGLASAVEFSFAERPGGTFRGSCDDKGVLRGTFVLGKTRSPFELRPLPKAWPGVYRVERKATRLPNNPVCARAAKQNDLVTTTPPGQDTPFIHCLPINPQRRRDVLDDVPGVGCSVVDRGHRLFALASPTAERMANQHLRSTEFDRMVQEIKLCNGHVHGSADQSIVSLHPAIATFSNFSSHDDGGGHPRNGSSGSVSIDLVTGAALKLTQIVTQPDALRELAGRCWGLYRHVRTTGSVTLPEKIEPLTCANQHESGGRFLWRCEQGDRDEPAWSLVSEGIVIGVWANPHATAAEEGQGPILPWSVLLREKLLRVDSPVKALWATVTPAAEGALTCSSAFEGKTQRSWRDEPHAP